MKEFPLQGIKGYGRVSILNYMEQKIKQSMFYGAPPVIFEKAKMLRLNMTHEENLLWEHLRLKIEGLRFKAQHPIADYIVDFYCHKAKLVIEIDGSSHHQVDQKQYDEGRTFELEQLGLKVIRFSNEDIRTDIERALNIIRELVRESIIINPLTP